MNWLRHRVADCLRWVEGFLYSAIGGQLSDWFGELARKVEPDDD